MTRTQLRLIIKALILKRPGSMFFFFVCDRNAFPTSSRMEKAVIEQQKEPRRNFWVTATSRQLLPLKPSTYTLPITLKTLSYGEQSLVARIPKPHPYLSYFRFPRRPQNNRGVYYRVIYSVSL